MPRPKRKITDVPLTERERAVLEYYQQGHKPSDIAWIIDRTPGSVYSALDKCCEKLGVQGWHQLRQGVQGWSQLRQQV